MRPSKIRVAKYEHSATSKWVVEGLKNNKGKRCRRFFHTRIEADDFARDALEEQYQYGRKAQHLPDDLRLSAIRCVEKLSVDGKSLEDATESLLERLRVSQRSCSLNKLVSEYLENKQGKGLSRRHLQDLKNRLGEFASFAGEKTASEIKPEQIEQWLQQFGGENYNNYHRQRVTSATVTEKRAPFSNALGGGLGTVRSSGPRKQHAQFALCSKVLLVRSPVKIHDA